MSTSLKLKNTKKVGESVFQSYFKYDRKTYALGSFTTASEAARNADLELRILGAPPTMLSFPHELEHVDLVADTSIITTKPINKRWRAGRMKCAQDDKPDTKKGEQQQQQQRSLSARIKGSRRLRGESNIDVSVDTNTQQQHERQTTQTPETKTETDGDESEDLSAVYKSSQSDPFRRNTNNTTAKRLEQGPCASCDTNQGGAFNDKHGLILCRKCSQRWQVRRRCCIHCNYTPLLTEIEQATVCPRCDKPAEWCAKLNVTMKWKVSPKVDETTQLNDETDTTMMASVNHHTNGEKLAEAGTCIGCQTPLKATSFRMPFGLLCGRCNARWGRKRTVCTACFYVPTVPQLSGKMEYSCCGNKDWKYFEESEDRFLVSETETSNMGPSQGSVSPLPQQDTSALKNIVRNDDYFYSRFIFRGIEHNLGLFYSAEAAARTADLELLALGAPADMFSFPEECFGDKSVQPRLSFETNLEPHDAPRVELLGTDAPSRTPSQWMNEDVEFIELGLDDDVINENGKTKASSSAMSNVLKKPRLQKQQSESTRSQASDLALDTATATKAGITVMELKAIRISIPRSLFWSEEELIIFYKVMQRSPYYHYQVLTESLPHKSRSQCSSWWKNFKYLHKISFFDFVNTFEVLVAQDTIPTSIQDKVYGTYPELAQVHAIPLREDNAPQMESVRSHAETVMLTDVQDGDGEDDDLVQEEVYDVDSNNNSTNNNNSNNNGNNNNNNNNNNRNNNNSNNNSNNNTTNGNSNNNSRNSNNSNANNNNNNNNNSNSSNSNDNAVRGGKVHRSSEKNRRVATPNHTRSNGKDKLSPTREKATQSSTSSTSSTSQQPQEQPQLVDVIGSQSPRDNKQHQKQQQQRQQQQQQQQRRRRRSNDDDGVVNTKTRARSLDRQQQIDTPRKSLKRKSKAVVKPPPLTPFMYIPATEDSRLDRFENDGVLYVQNKDGSRGAKVSGVVKCVLSKQDCRGLIKWCSASVGAEMFGTTALNGKRYDRLRGRTIMDKDFPTSYLKNKLLKRVLEVSRATVKNLLDPHVEKVVKLRARVEKKEPELLTAFINYYDGDHSLGWHVDGDRERPLKRGSIVILLQAGEGDYLYMSPCAEGPVPKKNEMFCAKMNVGDACVVGLDVLHTVPEFKRTEPRYTLVAFW